MADIPSRLQRKAQGPVTGLGSGYAKNQALAGAQDPEAAAALAALSPEDRAALEEDHLERSTSLLDMISEIVLAWNADDWTPPGAPELDAKGRNAWLESREDSVLSRWHSDMVQAREATIDDEQEAQLRREVSNVFAMDPSDPLYDPMIDKERRKRIEATLEPLDFESMIFNEYVDQEISLRENFTIVLRSIGTQHGLWVEMMLTDAAAYSNQYGRHWFSLMQVACSLQTINKREIGPDLQKFDGSKPEHHDGFQKALKMRMSRVGRLPGPLTDDLIVQYTWFFGRLRKLLAGDLVRKVGN
jgi:hypothetical protein